MHVWPEIQGSDRFIGLKKSEMAQSIMCKVENVFAHATVCWDKKMIFNKPKPILYHKIRHPL